MSIIKDPLLFVGSKGEKILYTLFDSGANLSCINPENADIANLESLGRVRRIATASEGHYIEVKYAVRLDFYMNDVLLSDEFLVVLRLERRSDHRSCYHAKVAHQTRFRTRQSHC